MKERDKILDKYKWDVSQIYKDIEMWRKDFDILKQSMPKIKQFEGKLNDKEMLLKLYAFEKEMDILSDKVVIYIYLQHLIDVANDTYNGYLCEVENLLNEYSLDSAFVLPELNSYDVKYLESLLDDERFKLHYMEIKDIIKSKPHILSFELEEVVTKVGNFSGAFSDTFEAFDAIDIDFDFAVDANGKRHPLTNSNYIKLLESKDRVLRKSAYLSYHNAIEANASTIANNYIGSVKKDCFYADVYKWNSVLESNLDDRDLSLDVYNKLIENVNKYLPLKHRWNKIKKRALKLRKAYPYDMGVPLSENDRSFSYEEACEIVKSALSVLGEDYLGAITKAINTRWIDVYPTENKDTGACDIDMYGNHSRILLNFEGTFNDVASLAHELGHAMHAYFSELNQPYEYCGTNLVLAEIASTTNEVLLKKYMLNKSTNKDEKIFILQEYINLIVSALFGQTMFSEFEDYAHKLVENKEPITKELLFNKYYELQSKYSGDAVEMMDEQRFGFLLVPHFYKAYYVYTYATGITCAINFAKFAETDEKGIENIRKFLASGLSDYPLNTLNSCGIDLESNEPYEVIMNELKWAIDEIEKLLFK